MVIYNLIINNQVAYVGQTSNVKQRYKQHKSLLKLNKHKNRQLQSAYNRYKHFDMVVIKDNASDRDEQIEINKHKLKQRRNNVMPSIDELRVLHRHVF